jgi:hypothetical protein
VQRESLPHPVIALLAIRRSRLRAAARQQSAEPALCTPCHADSIAPPQETAMAFGKAHSREIEEFGVTLARDFSKAYSLADATGERKVIKKLARAIDATCDRASAYQKEKKLGVYGKAKLGTAFKWELKSIGYRDDFIDELTQNMLMHLSA